MGRYPRQQDRRTCSMLKPEPTSRSGHRLQDVRRHKLSRHSQMLFLKLVLCSVTSGLSPMAPHSHPPPQQPTAFLGFLHRVWVHDRNTERRIEMGYRGGREGKVGRGLDVYSSYIWIPAQCWGVQFTCFSITLFILSVIPQSFPQDCVCILGSLHHATGLGGKKHRAGANVPSPHLVNHFQAPQVLRASSFQA